MSSGGIGRREKEVDCSIKHCGSEVEGSNPHDLSSIRLMFGANPNLLTNKIPVKEKENANW